ncbi:hypothetical protein AYI68_g599 [Smittium mucronatum]|uniref:Uncharacterized protein n=1 Tax=Smittium mucronatum TaxID=133383 RepID=A0A1R0H817_9FUNG|nr:hypothetical protein AYI68_g599 [Smittium mucronatum]
MRTKPSQSKPTLAHLLAGAFLSAPPLSKNRRKEKKSAELVVLSVIEQLECGWVVGIGGVTEYQKLASPITPPPPDFSCATWKKEAKVLSLNSNPSPSAQKKIFNSNKTAMPNLG